MAKFKEPLSKHPNRLGGTVLRGAAGISPEFVASLLKNNVVETMKSEFGIPVTATEEEITVGGLFNSKTQPGVRFHYSEHPDWANVLVGVNVTGAMLSVDAVGLGTVSAGMQRKRSADQKGMFSITGAIQRAFTDTNAVEEEDMSYDALITAINEAVESLKE